MQDLLQKAVERMRESGADFCDARWQSLDKTLVTIVDAGVRTLTDDHMAGVSLPSSTTPTKGP